MNTTTWRALIHGPSKVGKSWLGDTCPKPLLILDAEGRAHFGKYSGPKVFWNPLEGPPPAADGTWATCIVTVVDYQTVNLVYQYLRSGQHPFVSVKLDSIMEIQKRCIDSVVPGNVALERDHYSVLLREVEKKVREYRDLTLIPSNNVKVVLFISGTNDETHKPLLVGAIREQLAYYFDTVGYLHKQPQADGSLLRCLLIDEQPGFVAGDGTDRLKSYYGPVIPLPDDGTQYITEWYNTLLANGGIVPPERELTHE